MRASCVLGHQHGPKQQPRPETYSRPLVVMSATDFNTDPCCCMTGNPEVALRCSTGPDFTMTSGTGQATPIRLFLSTLVPPVLYSAQNSLLFFLSHLHHILAHSSGFYCRQTSGWLLPACASWCGSRWASGSTLFRGSSMKCVLFFHIVPLLWLQIETFRIWRLFGVSTQAIIKVTVGKILEKYWLLSLF